LETSLIIKTARATILYVQPEIKFRSPPGYFQHEPPLVVLQTNLLNCFQYGSACKETQQLTRAENIPRTTRTTQPIIFLKINAATHVTCCKQHICKGMQKYHTPHAHISYRWYFKHSNANLYESLTTSYQKQRNTRQLECVQSGACGSLLRDELHTEHALKTMHSWACAVLTFKPNRRVLQTPNEIAATCRYLYVCTSFHECMRSPNHCKLPPLPSFSLKLVFPKQHQKPS